MSNPSLELAIQAIREDAISKLKPGDDLGNGLVAMPREALKTQKPPAGEPRAD
jgi:hypothetical protein